MNENLRILLKGLELSADENMRVNIKLKDEDGEVFFRRLRSLFQSAGHILKFPVES